MRSASPCVCVNLRRAARSVTELYDVALAPAGVKVTQFSILRAIQRAGALPLSALAAELQLDRTTLARNLKPLQREGLVGCEGCDDLRVRRVALTARGARAIERAAPLWRDTQAAVKRALGQEKLDALTALLVEVQAIAAPEQQP